MRVVIEWDVEGIIKTIGAVSEAWSPRLVSIADDIARAHMGVNALVRVVGETRQYVRYQDSDWKPVTLSSPANR